MWRSKKFIIVAVLAAVVLLGGTAGVVLARTGSGSQAGLSLAQNVSDNVSQHDVLFTKITEILQGQGITITSEQLKDAFTQAQSEMRDEALQDRLQKLVTEGKITQKQADDYKAWLQARPDMEQFGQQLKEWQQARPSIPPELNEWQQARPDVPFGPSFKDHSGFRGMGGPRCWGK